MRLSRCPPDPGRPGTGDKVAVESESCSLTAAFRSTPRILLLLLLLTAHYFFILPLHDLVVSHTSHQSSSIWLLFAVGPCSGSSARSPSTPYHPKYHHRLEHTSSSTQPDTIRVREIASSTPSTYLCCSIYKPLAVYIAIHQSLSVNGGGILCKSQRSENIASRSLSVLDHLKYRNLHPRIRSTVRSRSTPHNGFHFASSAGLSFHHFRRPSHSFQV